MAADLKPRSRGNAAVAWGIAGCISIGVGWPIAVHAFDAPKIAAFLPAALGAPPNPWRFATLPGKTATRYVGDITLAP